VATVKIPPDRPGVESDWLAPDDAIGVYKRSKVLAEQEALAAAKGGAPVVIVNPSAPFGPWDVKPTPTGAIVERYLRGGLDGRGYIATGLNVVDVRDCAEGHLLAAERGVAGERYILGGENVTLKQILELLAEITGGPKPFKVPRPVAWMAAVVDEFFTGTLRGKTPKATREALKMARYTMWFDSTRAQQELGFESRSAKEALTAAVEWCRAHGRAK
ncbi:MAG: NAD-dependent epimerase/dehydratase family protein, partial [Planctomycetota bacterium]